MVRDDVDPGESLVLALILLQLFNYSITPKDYSLPIVQFKILLVFSTTQRHEYLNLFDLT